jgi:hypothetical protein
MRTVAQLSATFAALTALLAALLVLGSYVVVQGASARLRRLWFGLLAALLVGALGLGVLALVLNGLA